MKILHVINNLGSGGAEKLLVDLIPLLKKLNKTIEVEILLLSKENNIHGQVLENKGVNIHILSNKNLYDFRNVFFLCKFLKNNKFDIIHSHLFPTQYWVALTKLIMLNGNTKYITTEHSTNNKRRGKKLLLPLERFIYSQYNVVISITNETQVELIKWIKPPKKKLSKYVVIKNGVNLREISLAKSYNKGQLVPCLNEDDKLICMIGRFSEAKDQPTLIKAMKHLPINSHLLLVGEGHLVGENEKLVSELKLSERVHFLGFRYDVNSILKTSDVVVLSSNWEGFGLAAVEGMAAGKPVLVSSVNGLSSIVEDEDLRFPKGDFEELGFKIKKLFDDKEYYNEKVEYSLKRSAQFDISNQAKGLLDLYTNIDKDGGNTHV